MTPSSYAWLGAILVLALLALIAAHRFGLVEAVAHRLERRPPPRVRGCERSHVGPPRPLPRGTPPCDLHGWDGPRDAA